MRRGWTGEMNLVTGRCLARRCPVRCLLLSARRTGHLPKAGAVETHHVDLRCFGTMETEHDPRSVGRPRRIQRTSPWGELKRDLVEGRSVGVHEVQLPVGPLEEDPFSIRGPGVVLEG